MFEGNTYWLFSITHSFFFHLHDILCVLNIHKNLISVHHFTKQNYVFLEFHPLYFFVKERSTGVILVKGACKNVVYMFPNSIVASSTLKMVAYVHELTSIDGWHKHLGHPSIKVVQNLVNLFSLPLTTNKLPSTCSSCSINKAYQQPFGTTNF